MLRDSGEREQYESGAMREPASGRGRYDLLPPYPLERLAKHYENGAVKYADRNWEKGLPTGRCMDSAIRHLFQYLDGDNVEDHLAAAVWNLFAIMHFEREISAGRMDTSLWTLPRPLPLNHD